MKKYILISMFFIAALATANAGCGGCEEKKCEGESKKECCGGDAEKGKSCCADKEKKEKKEKEHKHE